jgi:hypothetical protein
MITLPGNAFQPLGTGLAAAAAAHFWRQLDIP